MDHREGQRRALLDVDFRNSDVKAGADVRPGGAAGNYAQLGAFLGDDDVVDALRERVRFDVCAGLDGIFGLRALFCADEVAALLRAGGALGEYVVVLLD